MLNKSFRSRLGRSRALRVSILCSALEMVLRCSQDTMKEYADNKSAEMFSTLLHVIEIFASKRGYSTVREVALSKTARIMHRICAQGVTIGDNGVETLLMLLKADVSTDTRTDASCALASLAVTGSKKHFRNHIRKIEKMPSPLISTLTTAASSAPDNQVEEVLDALLNLASSSEIIRVKMVKRTCTLRLLGQSMKSAMPEIRCNAFMIAKCLLRCDATFVELFAATPLNGHRLLQGLTTAVLNESEAEMQYFITCILTATLTNMNSNLDQIEMIIDSLTVVAGSAAQDRTANEAALAICKKAPALDEASGANAFITVAGLAQTSSANVRAEAFRALQKLCSCGATCRFLVKQEAFQQAIVRHLTEGTDEDVFATMAILEAVAGYEDNRETICQSTFLVGALVEIVTKEAAVADRTAYMMGVETLLLLMSEDANLKYFLHFAELLPWLSDLANSTTSSKELKKDMVSAIIRLTAAMLE